MEAFLALPPRSGLPLHAEHCLDTMTVRTPHFEHPGSDARRRWIGILAKGPGSSVQDAWDRLPEKPTYTFLRPPEVGSALVRARIGGTGRRFNVGEMTVTRCAVRLSTGQTGFAYVAGRDRRHAELAAVFDALLQLPEHYVALEETLIEPLSAAQAARKHARGSKAAATRVDFFTLVRGDE